MENNLNDVVIVSEAAVDQEEDSSICGLRAGDNITVNDLLYGLMLNSGNDAAQALAEYHSGSVEEFAKVMTEEAHIVIRTTPAANSIISQTIRIIEIHLFSKQI